jgi:hypothetical protein
VRSRRVAIILLCSVTAAGLLAGCGDGRSPDVPRTSALADDPTAGVPPFPHGTALQTAKQSGAWDLVFTDVRVVQHQGFDRIELDFQGTGTPGWGIDYVDKPVLEGSGKHVPLSGDAFLNISASGTTWPARGYYDGRQQFEPESGGDVVDVYVGGTFEGYTQVLVGIGSGRVPFRVFALTGPPRLVVDVVDATARNR